MTSTAPSELPYDPTAPLTPSGNLRRRLIVSRIAQGMAVAAAFVAVFVLGVATNLFARSIARRYDVSRGI